MNLSRIITWLFWLWLILVGLCIYTKHYLLLVIALCAAPIFFELMLGRLVQFVVWIVSRIKASQDERTKR